MTAMIDIEHLTKRFSSITAVDDISFQVDRGEVLGFLGPNGAGKSTTMKMITGFLAPDAGAVRVDGIDITARPVDVKSRLGYLPEGAPLYGDMTPAAFLEFTGQVRGLRGKELRRRIAETVDRVNLGQVLRQPIETLSKGFKRRVGIAQAVLHDPEVLVLDEPTDGLDPNQKYEVRGLIREMAREKVIILSTHILEEVDAVCSRAIIIAGGKVVADGVPAELEERAPRHNAVALAVCHPEGHDVVGPLQALDGVDRVESLGSEGELAHYVVLPSKGGSIIDAVSARVREQGWQVAEMHVERGRLDDVFREITGGAHAVN